MLSLESLLGWVPSAPRAPIQDEDREAMARRVVVEMLPRLEETRRLILALRYFEELTLPEISRALGLESEAIRRMHQETIALIKREIRARWKGTDPEGAEQ